MIPTNRYRQVLEKMYTDRATIQRRGLVEAPNHETVMQPIAVYENQPCRLSQQGLGRNNQTEAQNDIRYDAKLFISPELVIKQGDSVTITRGETVLQFTAGEPFPYSTHQEINLSREGYA
ncbi:ABC transporter ATP-binding protein [Paenibacillus gansuensis]|uniref:ABC transporter ATP-binding protein n=1 Tax=Paenibacillus gansuensis TaxID=306542 RepID=A0ABW5PF68_9BACL